MPPPRPAGWHRRPRPSSSATPSSPTTAVRAARALADRRHARGGACQLFSKRAAEITAAVESKGYDTYQARQTAARDTRSEAAHPAGRADGRLASPSWRPPATAPAGMLADVIEAAATRAGHARRRLLSPAAGGARRLGPRTRRGAWPSSKVFTRADVAVAVGPLLFGARPRELVRAVERSAATPRPWRSSASPAAREQAYAPACVIASEAAIAVKVAPQAERTDAPAVEHGGARRRSRPSKRTIGGRPLTDGQTAMIVASAPPGGCRARPRRGRRREDHRPRRRPRRRSRPPATG